MCLNIDKAWATLADQSADFVSKSAAPAHHDSRHEFHERKDLNDASNCACGNRCADCGCRWFLLCSFCTGDETAAAKGAGNPRRRSGARLAVSKATVARRLNGFHHRWPVSQYDELDA